MSGFFGCRPEHDHKAVKQHRKPVDTLFREALSRIPPVDGHAVSAYTTAGAGGGQCQESKCSRATAKT